MSGADDKQRDEFNAAFRTVKAEAGDRPLIEPTDEEKRNGWDAESLTDYVNEQKAAQSLRSDPHSMTRRLGRRPTRQTRNYRPLRWRG